MLDAIEINAFIVSLEQELLDSAGLVLYRITSSRCNRRLISEFLQFRSGIVFVSSARTVRAESFTGLCIY